MRVPVYEPGQVQERPSNRQGIDVQATPAAFGGAAARGLGDLAAGLGEVSQGLQQMQALDDNARAKEQTNWLRDQVRDLQYNPQGGYLTSQGRNAVDGRPVYETKIGELISQGGKDLSPSARKLYEQAADNLRSTALGQGIQHYGSEWRNWQRETSDARVATLQNDAVAAYRDPAAVDRSVALSRGELADRGALEGWSSDKLKYEQEAAERKIRDDVARLDANDINSDPSRNGAIFKRSGPAIQATDIPPEGAALLNVISGTESPDYNVLNGGERFGSFADHPRRKGQGGTTTAAGRYQFVKGTWDRASSAIGARDFSPANQDRGAWWLAQADYKSNTGRDLLSDLRSNDPIVQSAVRRGLSSTWEGLKSLGDESFVSKLRGSPTTLAGASREPSFAEAETFYRDRNPNASPQVIQSLASAAVTARTQFDNREIVAIKSMIDTASDNAPIAIQNTGSYSGAMPTPDDFARAYGLEGARRYEAFQASVDVAGQAHDFQTMPVTQIGSIVDAARPTEDGPSAAIQQKKYETLSKAAETTIKAREADPVTYVQQAFPSIKTTWEAAARDPSQLPEAFRQTAAAQSQLGIAPEKQALLPTSVAARTVARFKDDAVPGDERINGVISTIMATPDRGQRQTVFNQLVQAGLPEAAEGALEAAARGDTGAAQRLMAAVVTDPAKLPGKLPETDANIHQAIEDNIMADGEIGDAVYGLSVGSTENYERASRDADLINRSVKMRIREGQTLDDAVAGVKKDLYGDSKVYTGGWGSVAMIVVPKDTDMSALGRGLTDNTPLFRQEMERRAQGILERANAPAADGGRAILEAASKAQIDRIMDEGEFRSVNGGIGLFDRKTGTFVPGPDGKPYTLPLERVLGAKQATERMPTITQDGFVQP